MVERKKNRSMWSSFRNFKRKIFSNPIIKKKNQKKKMKRSDVSKKLQLHKLNHTKST